MIKNLAPIVLFVYNRPLHSRKTLTALKLNQLASESVLYVFCDGPKENATQELLKNIEEVRELVHAEKWCKEVQVIESKTNRGLADSIIYGVTEVVEKYGRVIVLEDDLVTSPYFLNYMNDALDFYENTERVMHVSGYMFPHKEALPETFFYNVPMCWGWGTWHRAWKYFNEDEKFLYEYFEENKLWDNFNKFGGKYLHKQLESNYLGKLKTWFVKWHAVNIIQNGLTVFPHQSLVQNVGFDEMGTNCTTPMTKFDVQILTQNIKLREIPIKESKKARRIIIHFYQGRYYFLRHFFIKLTPDWIKPFVLKIIKPLYEK